MGETIYLVVYDLTDDRARARVASRLRDYGLRRIQYSAFVGELEPRRFRSLVVDLRRLIARARGERRVVHIFPVPASSLSKVTVIGGWKGGRAEVERSWERVKVL